MGLSWKPSAFWMTVNNDLVPELHGTRCQAIEYAKKHRIMAYRQDAHTGRVDVVYDWETGEEFAPGKRVALASRFDPALGYVRG